MGVIYNIYCDESCHLQNDHQQVMVLGAIWCPLEKTREIAMRLCEIKLRHGLSPNFEVKWSKVSPAKLLFYKDLIDYFFDDDDLHFRALIIPDKSKLRHQDSSQDYDTWYYTMYFDLLEALLKPTDEFRIYLDIKDTKSGDKIRKLYEALCNNMYDFERKIVTRIQAIHSHEIEQLQLADLLIGAVSYVNRDIHTSRAKQTLIERTQLRSHYSLIKMTLVREEKVNLFRQKAG